MAKFPLREIKRLVRKHGALTQEQIDEAMRPEPALESAPVPMPEPAPVRTTWPQVEQAVELDPLQCAVQLAPPRRAVAHAFRVASILDDKDNNQAKEFHCNAFADLFKDPPVRTKHRDKLRDALSSQDKHIHKAENNGGLRYIVHEQVMYNDKPSIHRRGCLGCWIYQVAKQLEGGE